MDENASRDMLIVKLHVTVPEKDNTTKILSCIVYSSDSFEERLEAYTNMIDECMENAPLLTCVSIESYLLDLSMLQAASEHVKHHAIEKRKTMGNVIRRHLYVPLRFRVGNDDIVPMLREVFVAAGFDPSFDNYLKITGYEFTQEQLEATYVDAKSAIKRK